MAEHLDIPTVRRFERLAHLGRHTVAKGMLDPRGWKVIDGHGQPVGAVKDLIVDTDRMVATFIDVELDATFFSLRADPRVLVPMHHADRDGEARRLVVPELTRSRVAALVQARDDSQLRFWNSWWQTEDRLDAHVEPASAPAPAPYATAPPRHDDPLATDDRRAR